MRFPMFTRRNMSRDAFWMKIKNVQQVTDSASWFLDVEVIAHDQHGLETEVRCRRLTETQSCSEKRRGSPYQP